MSNYRYGIIEGPDGVWIARRHNAAAVREADEWLNSGGQWEAFSASLERHVEPDIAAAVRKIAELKAAEGKVRLGDLARVAQTRVFILNDTAGFIDEVDGGGILVRWMGGASEWIFADTLVTPGKVVPAEGEA